MPGDRKLEWLELLTRQLQNETGGRVDLAALRGFVDRYVAYAKGEGQQSEQVIRALKEITTPAIRLHASAEQWSRIYDDIFQWCLDAYYGPSPARESHTAATKAPRPEVS